MKLPDVGAVIAGRFRLDSVLGEGGFARVFAGWDLVDDVPVALKVLRPRDQRYEPQRVARFEREASLLNRLRSPHTVRLLGHGHTEQGVLFLAFELVGGRDLTALLAEGPARPTQVREIVVQVLHALAEAHASGIIHRDIKPANIRVDEPDGGTLNVTLLDFGVAKPTDPRAEALTATGQVVGTLGYLAPEQLFSDEVTPACDIFSLGLVAYTMLTGARTDHLRAIASGRRVALEAGAIPDPTLTAVINRMLEPDVERRFANAGEVLADLERSGDGAVPRRDASPLPHHTASSGSSTLPSRVGIAAGVASVLALTVVVGLAWQSRTSERAGASTQTAPPPTDANPLGQALVEPPTDEEPPPPEPVRAEAPDPCEFASPFVGSGFLSEPSGLGTVRWPTYIPDKPRPKRGYALVILVHGAGLGAAAFLKDSGVDGLAEEHGFVVIAPDDGIVGPWADHDDIEIVREALHGATESICIDPERIYALGHGGGGIVVEQIPCEMSEVTAIATMNYRSTPGVRECDSMPPIPHLHFAALEDGHNPVEGGGSCMGTHRISLAEKEDRWRRINQCGPDRTVRSEHDGSVCYEWACEQPFVSCHIEGGHNWPRMERPIYDVLNCDGPETTFPVNDYVWEFFDGLHADRRAADEE